MATGSSNGNRLPLDKTGELKTVGEVGLLTIPGDGGIYESQGYLCSLVQLDNELPFDQAAVNDARALAGYEPPPEFPEDFVTETSDGLPLAINTRSGGYLGVYDLGGSFTVRLPQSFSSYVRKYFKTRRTYATALDAATEIARRVKSEADIRAASIARCPDTRYSRRE